VKDLEAAVAGCEAGGVAFVYRVHVVRALLVPSLRTEKGRRGDASDDATERRCISAHEGSRRVLAPLHELLEIVQVVVHNKFLSSDGIRSDLPYTP